MSRGNSRIPGMILGASVGLGALRDPAGELGRIGGVMASWISARERGKAREVPQVSTAIDVSRPKGSNAAGRS
jgi:hypothetical protein